MGQIYELTPRGREFLFFSLFGIVGKTSSFIGPFVSSAIIDRYAHSHGVGNSTSSAFYFLMPLTLVSTIGLTLGVDVPKSKREQDLFLDEKQVEKEKRQMSVQG